MLPEDLLANIPKIGGEILRVKKMHEVLPGSFPDGIGKGPTPLPRAYSDALKRNTRPLKAPFTARFIGTSVAFDSQHGRELFNRNGSDGNLAKFSS